MMLCQTILNKLAMLCQTNPQEACNKALSNNPQEAVKQMLNKHAMIYQANHQQACNSALSRKSSANLQEGSVKEFLNKLAIMLC
jgi:hypothetical protein